jgi:hypothetical protein
MVVSSEGYGLFYRPYEKWVKYTQRGHGCKVCFMGHTRSGPSFSTTNNNIKISKYKSEVNINMVFTT